MPAPCCGYVFFLSWLQWHRVTSLPPAPHCSIRPWHVWRASSCCALRRLAPRWVTSCWPLSMGKPTTPGSRWTTQSAGWSVADTELTAQPYPILGPKWMAYPMLAIVMHGPRIWNISIHYVFMTNLMNFFFGRIRWRMLFALNMCPSHPYLGEEDRRSP